MALTAMQARFVAEYQKDENGTQAAIRAGAKADNAAITASKWLRLAKVQEALANVYSKALERAQVKLATDQAVASAEWIVTESVRLYERCMQDVPVLTAKGEPTGVYQFDSAGANRALDRLAKRHAEFSDKHEVNGSLTVEAVTVVASMSEEELRARLAARR